MNINLTAVGDKEIVAKVDRFKHRNCYQVLIMHDAKSIINEIVKNIK